MTTMGIASMLFGLIVSSSLLFCGALIAAAAPQVPGLIWLAVLMFWLAMWGRR